MPTISIRCTSCKGRGYGVAFVDCDTCDGCGRLTAETDADIHDCACPECFDHAMVAATFCPACAAAKCRIGNIPCQVPSACNSCLGTGYVDCDNTDRGGAHVTKTSLCTDCDSASDAAIERAERRGKYA